MAALEFFGLEDWPERYQLEEKPLLQLPSFCFKD